VYNLYVFLRFGIYCPISEVAQNKATRTTSRESNKYLIARHTTVNESSRSVKKNKTKNEKIDRLPLKHDGTKGITINNTQAGTRKYRIHFGPAEPTL
jgi:hypothetical protein